MSKGFGSPRDSKVIQHIQKGIRLALDDSSAFFPYFISPVNGNTFPLSPYYSKRFLRLEDLGVFQDRKPNLTDYDSMIDSTPDLSPEERLLKQYKFDIVSASLDERHTYFDDDFNLENNFDGEIKDVPFLGSDFADNWQNSDFGDCDMF